MSIPAYLKYIGLTLLFVVAAVNFTRTTLSVIQSSKRLEELRGEVSDLEKQKGGLEGELEYKKTDGFIEREAREKLGFVKPGEELFVVKNVLGELTHRDSKSETGANVSNARAWINLFF